MASRNELQEDAQPIDPPPVGLADRAILVVEDHPAHRQMTQAVLTALGHQVTMVEDGLAAVEAASAAAFDVIVMDRNMPRCGGDEAVRAIRAQPGPSRHAIIICHSTDLPAGDAAALYDDVLEKPATVPVVRALLERVRARLDVVPASAPAAASRG
ncbi:response regulator [uncultured Phenylobacterium sp.]|uniref:response regulator n=1 Tax=uncultured Phenylobacterium sp. TaxID=349273 RepID=UPI0025D3F41D|nr:response regulator [uncultured Phenylobacterium sp.]